MKCYLKIAFLVIVGALTLGLYSSLYTLEEGQQAVVVQFGRPVGETVTEAGLHMKLPFVQKVLRFEKRLLFWDGDPNQIPTKGREFIWVDTTARWRISDAKRFLENVAPDDTKRFLQLHQECDSADQGADNPETADPDTG